MVKDGLAESKRFNLVANHFHAPIAPGTIDFRTVRCKPEYASDGSITGVRVRWDPPANGFNYDKYSLWEHISYLEYKSDTTSILLKSPRFTPGVTLQVWVRTVVGDQVGPYSEKVLCDIPEKQY